MLKFKDLKIKNSCERNMMNITETLISWKRKKPSSKISIKNCVKKTKPSSRTYKWLNKSVVSKQTIKTNSSNFLTNKLLRKIFSMIWKGQRMKEKRKSTASCPQSLNSKNYRNINKFCLHTKLWVKSSKTKVRSSCKHMKLSKMLLCISNQTQIFWKWGGS